MNNWDEIQPPRVADASVLAVTDSTTLRLSCFSNLQKKRRFYMSHGYRVATMNIISSLTVTCSNAHWALSIQPISVFLQTPPYLAFHQHLNHVHRMQISETLPLNILLPKIETIDKTDVLGVFSLFIYTSKLAERAERAHN